MLKKKKPWKIQSIISFILQTEEVESEKFRDYQHLPNLVGSELEELSPEPALSYHEAPLRTLAIWPRPMREILVLKVILY